MSPLLSLSSADGARVEYSLHGGHVCGWFPAGERDSRLFLSARADFGGSIRGGVPVIFPQFNARGPLPRHGFARLAPWRCLDQGPGQLLLELDHALATDPRWPQPYRLRERLSFGGKHLRIELELHNPGTEPLRFHAALHTYFAMGPRARLYGLQGATLLDARHGESPLRQDDAELACDQPLDLICPQAPSALELREPGRRLRIASEGFRDAVIWNPGTAGAGVLADLEPGDEHRFVCVEAADLLEHIVVAPGGRWQGAQDLTALAP